MSGDSSLRDPPAYPGYAPDFDTLCGLVHASPQLHRVYVEDRLSILRECVQQLLEGILFDAHAAYVSEQDYFQQTRTVTRLWQFLKDYQRRRSMDTESALAAQLSLEDVIGLIRFHRSIIEPLTERYATWALEALPVATQEKRLVSCSFVDRDMWNSLPAAVKAVLTHRAGTTSPVGIQAREQTRPSHLSREWPLSDTERRRIQRGMYRWEIFCNVVGDKGGGRSSSNYIGGPQWLAGEDDYVEQLYVFALFPAWQVEEMLSIYEFMNDAYLGIFGQGVIALGLDSVPSPGLADLRPPYVNPHIFARDFAREAARNVLIRHCLTLFADVCTTTDHKTLVSMVRHGLHSVPFLHRCLRGLGWWMTALGSDRLQAERREKLYTEHDAAQDGKEETPFVQDTMESPSLGWVTFWGEIASNHFGKHYFLDLFRRWGLVMWDARRLEASGAALQSCTRAANILGPLDSGTNAVPQPTVFIRAHGSIATAMAGPF